jgi:hypothetical protein
VDSKPATTGVASETLPVPGAEERVFTLRDEAPGGQLVDRRAVHFLLKSKSKLSSERIIS